MENDEQTIKSAVSQPADDEMQQSLMSKQPEQAPAAGAPPAPGMMSNDPGYQQQRYDQYIQPYPAAVSGEYSQVYDQNQQGYDPYQQQGYAQGTSTDTINEIAEQVVTEKITKLKNDIEKVLDIRADFESKIQFLDQRLKRIESVIDKLQMSILQKVGEYVNNVSDLKNEVIETQKSFKSLLDKKHPIR